MTDVRRPNQFLQEPYQLNWEHPANANGGTVTEKIDKLTRKVKITRVKYINKTGLAEHADNHVLLSLKNGSTTIASWSTDADLMVADAGIAADTFMDLTLSATSTDLIVAAGDVLSFVVAESGTTTVPAGRVVVEGVYI